MQDVSNRRHALFQKAHGRRVQEKVEATGEATPSTSSTTTSTSSSSSSSVAAETEEEVDESVTIQLTRTPTKGTSTSKRAAPKKPTSTASATTNKKKSDDDVSDTVPTTPAESKRESNDNTRVSTMVTDPTYMPSYVPTSYTPTVEPSGKARKVDPDNYDDDSIITRTKSGKTDSGGGKGGKGSIPTSNVCEKRFDLAWEANVNASYIIARTKNDLKQLCAFDTTNTAASPFAPNLSCPFIYTPDTGFLDNETEVVDYFVNMTNVPNGTAVGTAFWLFQMYCECQLGIGNGCLASVPNLTSSSPDGKIQYCTFAGIWNGDFALNNYFELDNDVQTCGCYFVSVEQLGVDNCPGVDLGAFFVNPANTTRR
ncbi:hypothetical protein ACHAWX_002993 [Stephanocyclus meneghinianus]